MYNQFQLRCTFLPTPINIQLSFRKKSELFLNRQSLKKNEKKIWFNIKSLLVCKVLHLALAQAIVHM